MFYLKRLKKELLLPPSSFGPKLKETIRRQLIDEVEGMSLGHLGFVINVVKCEEEDIHLETLDYETGNVNVTVMYSAIAFRPFKNEVLDATVKSVSELGFFAEVGPLSIFVSRHSMPDDIGPGYDPAAEMFVSEDKQVEIKTGCGVRLRVVGVSLDPELSAVGTIKDDFLGLVSGAEMAF